MFNLIIKDMLLLKKTAIFALIYEIFLIFAFKEMPQGALLISIIGSTYILVTTSMAYEDKNNSDIVLNSLPLSRSEIVMTKYIEVFLFGIVASAVFTIIASIFKALNIDIGSINISFDAIAVALFAVSLMNGLYLPLFFKLGYIKSKYVNFVLFFVFFFSLQSIAGWISQGEIGGVIGKIGTLYNSFSQNIIGLLILAAAILFAVLSYSVAVSFYRTREF